MAAPGGEDYVLLGRVGAPYGVKGWVKLISFTEPSANLLEYRRFRLDDGREIEIDQSRPQGKTFVGHIKGCDDRESCRHYTGRELWVPKAELPELEADEFYWHQLEGLRVLTLAGEDLGRVDHLIETGANDVLVVRGDEKSVDRRERLLPYVPGQVVTEVDLDERILRVDWSPDYT